MEERRRAVDPHPPEGIADRRVCSDKQCREARLEWFEQEIMPKLQKQIWIAVGAVGGGVLTVFLWFQESIITKHELHVQNTYEKIVDHEEDIKLQRQEMESARTATADMLEKVLARQERILGIMETLQDKRR